MKVTGLSALRTGRGGGGGRPPPQGQSFHHKIRANEPSEPQHGLNFTNKHLTIN
jgi:hypothetical protein